MSSTPTPQEDNLLNRNDESMYRAIDKVMGNTEQTYEEFVSSFTQLKKEDLETKKYKSSADKLQNPENKTSQAAGKILLKSQETEATNEKLAAHEDKTKEDDELQEEVLEPGVVCGWMSKAEYQSSSVQVDNFIDGGGEDEIIDIEDTSNGYTASFATGPTENKNLDTKPHVSPQETQEKKKNIPGKKAENKQKVTDDKKSEKQSISQSQTESDTEKADDEDIALAHESIETMKNILLENFLSDFCDEMGLGGMVDMGFDELPDLGFGETEENEHPDDITFDDDPLELLLNITDTGTPAVKNYVRETISKSTHENDNQTVSKSKKKSRSRRRKKGKKKFGANTEQNASTEHHTILDESVTGLKDDAEINDDTESKAIKKDGLTQSADMSESNSNTRKLDVMSKKESKISEGEMEYSAGCEENFSGKLLYPGEVDEDETATGVSKETRLEFKATYQELQGNIATEENCSNEVEAFVLDQDFDYDNVVLTPKYSPEDMERLSQLMAGKVTL